MYSNSLQHKFGKGLFALLLAFSVSLSTAPTLFVLAEGEDATPPPATTETTPPPADSGETAPPPDNGESAPPPGDETLIDDSAADNATTTTENTETPPVTEGVEPQEDTAVDNTNDAVVESESGIEATTGEN